MTRTDVLRMSVGREERQSKQGYDPPRTFPIIPKQFLWLFFFKETEFKLEAAATEAPIKLNKKHSRKLKIKE